MNLNEIAMVAHEANRALCQLQGDHSQLPWAEAPEWQRVSAKNGVEHAKNPDAQPRDSHESWLAEKEAGGWVYGETKDPEAKTHPCIMPYDDLPPEQQIKDVLFLAVARALLCQLVSTP